MLIPKSLVINTPIIGFIINQGSFIASVENSKSTYLNVEKIYPNKGGRKSKKLL